MKERVVSLKKVLRRDAEVGTFSTSIIVPAPYSSNNAGKFMIAVKIECPCGQRYAFDVEPLLGQLPGPVACPVCGEDGTEAGNAILVQNLRPQGLSVPTPTPGGAVRMAGAQPVVVAQSAVVAASPTTVPAVHRTYPGQTDRTQAEHEARAKILWGDDSAEVTKYLRIQGWNAEDAARLIQTLLDERAATIRSNGVKKIISGIGMMCVPVAAFVVFMAMGVFLIKVFGAALVVGVWGGFRTLSGIIMFLSPRSEKGDATA